MNRGDNLEVALVSGGVCAAIVTIGALALRNGLSVSDVVSLGGNLLSVMSAVALAIYIEQRQRRARAVEVREFITDAIAKLEDIASRWAKFEPQARHQPIGYINQYIAFFSELDDAMAGLKPAQQLVSPENVKLLARAHQILAAYERTEVFHAALQRDIATVDTGVVATCHLIMDWRSAHGVAAKLNARLKE